MLPEGATVLDFAFAIHSEVGLRCVGAKRNGQGVPLDTKVRTGDTVEILTNRSARPAAGWLAMAFTGKAKGAIRKALNRDERTRLSALGGRLIDEEAAARGLTLDEGRLAAAAAHHGYAAAEDLRLAVGSGRLTPTKALAALGDRGLYRTLARALGRFRRRPARAGLPARLDGVSMRPAPCCAPVVGDPVAGILTDGRGILVHHAGCKALRTLRGAPERWVDLRWEEDGVVRASIHLMATLANRTGALAALTAALARLDASITDLAFARRGDASYTAAIALSLPEGLGEHALLAELHALPEILKAHACTSEEFLAAARRKE